MTTAPIRDQLRSAHFLQGLTDSAFHRLGQLVHGAAYETDQFLFREGARRKFLAILVEGAGRQWDARVVESLLAYAERRGIALPPRSGPPVDDGVSELSVPPVVVETGRGDHITA